MIHGILNVYKEAGYTSFDVVAKLRGILKQKKIGHTGTLDPTAEGVLPVCLGNGTKLCDMLTEKTKEYEAVLLLGIDTDTQDTTGEVLSEREVRVSEKEVREVIAGFVGEQMQIPPMYSAIKVDGKRLYELAREGKSVERKARPITIHSIEVKEIALPKVRILVHCSKGTYIRTLCHDIGEKLGCGGAMEHLLRTRSGHFSLENTLTLAQIEELVKQNAIEAHILPMEEALKDYLPMYVKQEWKVKIDNGNPLPPEAFTEAVQSADKEKRRIYNAEGIFFALYEFEEAKNRWIPDKIFPITE